MKGVFLSYNGFTVNFLQNSKRLNYNLHFRTRIDTATNQPIVALNYKRNNTWGAEIQATTNTFPFLPGRAFDVYFLLVMDAFIIYVDGRYLISYAYVMAVNTTKVIEVIGEIQNVELSFWDNFKWQGTLLAVWSVSMFISDIFLRGRGVLDTYRVWGELIISGTLVKNIYFSTNCLYKSPKRWQSETLGLIVEKRRSLFVIFLWFHF